MTTSARTQRTTLILGVLAASSPLAAALNSAAGGGGKGGGGFGDVVDFLDRIATYLIYLAVPGAVIGLIVAGGMFMSGKPDAQRWLATIAIGFILIVASKGIAA